MNKLAIDNLTQIARMRYQHICLSSADYYQFLNIPEQQRSFYPTYDKAAWGKAGFFNGGATLLWTSGSMKLDHIKFAGKKFPTSAECEIWSDPLLFNEINSLIKIQKFMKMKAFW